MAALDVSDDVLLHKSGSETSAFLGHLAQRITRHADEVLCGDDQRSHAWYRVMLGAVRVCAHLSDGRRRVIDFLLPGDMFTLYAPPVRRVCCEAIVSPTEIVRYSRPQIERLARSDRAIAAEFNDAAPRLIARLQAHTLMLGHASGLERVATFLLDFSRRSGAEDDDPIVLPMSRADIADYLGMAVESVSRALARLRREGVIECQDPRRLRVTNRSRLEELGAQYMNF